MSNKLADKNALILGASETGSIGATIAEHLLNAGAKVMIAARRKQQVDKLAKEIGATGAVCDISNEQQVSDLAAHALDTFKRLDIAINCAGQAVMGDIANTDAADLRKAVDVHLIGPFFFLKHMAAAIKENGSIITLSSITASLVINNHAAYVATKAGTDHLVRIAAIEYGHKNIKVNSVSPGFTDNTPMSKPFLKVDGLRELFEKEIPLGRLNNAADVAHVVSWLCEDNTYISGQNIQVNGGHSLTRLPSRNEFAALLK
ncbi:MAG: SDR family NAD(P)-dependent oxidoreductase [Gammaproteobacteria bacterium]